VFGSQNMKPDEKGLTTAQRRILWLLVLSAWLNFIDRGALSAAAPALKADLGLTPVQIGYLLSAFFWTYAGCQVITGWLADRFNVGRLYAVGFLVWSSAVLLTGFAGAFARLFALQFLLGMGESTAYPSYARILSREFPEHRRGLANALIDAASKTGPGVATFIGVLIITAFGWRTMYIGLGAVSLLWLPFWIRWAPREQRRFAAAPSGPGMGMILRRGTVWATFTGLFCFNYAYFFLVTWLPSYLVMERHFSMHRMAVFGGLPFIVFGGTSTAAGWISDMWIANGATPNRARKTFAVSGLLICAATLPALALTPDTAAIVLLLVTFFAIGLFTSNVWTITQSLAGPEAAGKWTGLQNAIGNVGSAMAPVVTGCIVTGTGGRFFLAFVAASVGLLIAAAMYLLGIGRIEALLWTVEEFQ
jgi:MFS transporter, ACS family, D-galactonate transporter